MFFGISQIKLRAHQSFVRLKKSLEVCAAFRGTYVDFKENDEWINAQNVDAD